MRQLWVVLGVVALLGQAACGAVVYSGPRNIVIDNSNSDVAVDVAGAGGGGGVYLFEYTWWQGDVELSIEGSQFAGSYFACAPVGPMIGPVDRMNAGDKIGADLLWQYTKDNGLLAGYYGTWWGGRFVGEAGYIGVKFDLADGTHYGWIAFEGEQDASWGLVTGWAFEDTPDTPIEAGQIPEPATLALLAAGAAFLKRRRS